MKSFLEIKIDNDYHSPDSPKGEFIAHCTNPSLSPAQESDIVQYNKMLRYEVHNNPVIFIGMGTCGLASGADKVKVAIENELIKHDIFAEIIPTGCIGYCAKEVIVDIKIPNGERIAYCEVTPKDVPALIKTTLIDKEIYKKNLLGTHGEGNENLPRINDLPFFRKQKKMVLENCGIINPNSIDEYIANGGFKALDKALRIMNPDAVVNEILESGLRGRGGGGFPTGKKWKFALEQKSDQKYIICNADEGDPGAFMDRSILESDPFRLIEGMIIGAYAIGANFGYIYCRAEYPLAIQRLENTIKRCKEYGLLGKDI